MGLQSLNYDFLSDHDPILVEYGALAERYFADDPSTCIIKLRQMAEMLAELAASYAGLQPWPDASFLDTLNQLQDRGILTREVSTVFHGVRKIGNRAVHEHGAGIGHGDALHQLKMLRALAVWFHRSFKDPGFSPGPFAPPSEPEDATASLEAELAELRAKVEETAAQAESEQAARLLAEAEAKKLAEEGAVWQSLAEETEAQLAAARPQFQERLLLIQDQAAESSAQTLNDVVTSAQTAGSDLELDEADTRRLIDEQLRDAGWEVDSQSLRWDQGVRPQKHRNLAIAEWPTETGPADYVLFSGLQALAVVEAKRKSKDVAGALKQAKRYSRGMTFDGGAVPAGEPWGEYRVPFLFSTNGRPYLKQLETKSGIWYLDARLPTNHPRPLVGWYSPDGLRRELDKNVAEADETLRSESTDYLPLRGYQHEAVRAVEQSIAEGNRTALVAMATGTGKTRTCIGLVYRLIKAGRFRRVLFLVDRSALGEQAGNAFKDVKLEQHQSFTDIYDVKELADLAPDSDTRLHLATVQGMIKRIIYPSDEDATPPVDRYDCIVIDECHRGYTLDREMSDVELSLRDERDYLSKYRRVVEHFDAVKIGLTATPALHTVEIFGEPVYAYSYRQAVVDGFLVDHEPPIRITTRLADEGIHWASGDDVPLYDPASSQLELFRTPDEIDFEIDHFNKMVLTENFNRVVCDELAQRIDPDLDGKTLVFCATDAHADMVVHLLTQALDAAYEGVDDNVVAKITGAADKPLELIRHYKNERLPSIAVTVDLLTTGIDVPEIVNIVFLRRVRSRILYEQMLGRATRLCPDIGKEAFRIFDAVDLYSILGDFTTMKPVVTNPKTSFEELTRLLTEAGTDDQRAQLHDQLVAKLQRKKRMLDNQHADEIRHHTGGTAAQLTRRVQSMAPPDAATWLAKHQALVRFLDAARPPAGKIYVSDHEDEVREIVRGYGEYDKPEDYLEAFTRYIEEHLNDIPALLVVTQRPRDLTREQLRDLRITLGDKGFTEQRIRTAVRDTTNQDIAATIIGFIRNRALGSPLIPYKKRVERALESILASHDWTQPQRRWLERIGQQLEKETVVDRAALDRGEFKQRGGFDRLNKVFGGKLQQVLGDISEALWEDTA